MIDSIKMGRTPLLAAGGIVVLLCICGWTYAQLRSVDKAPEDHGTHPGEPPSAQPEDPSRYIQRGHDTTVTSATNEGIQREAWVKNFPWHPTHDPTVIITEEIIASHRSGRFHPTVANHGFLRAFFENEARHTTQFQKLSQILQEYDRGNNPIIAGQIFQNLWDYIQAIGHHPEDIQMNQPNPWTQAKPVINLQTGEPITWGERAESLRNSILHNLAARREWPDLEAMSENEGHEVLNRILTEVRGMESLADPGFAYSTDYENELKLGDSPLVPYLGWQAAYDQWEEEMKQFRPSIQPHFSGIGPDNQLLDQKGNPIVVQGNQKIDAVLVTPNGQKVPLNQGAHGTFVIPTPQEIEEINSLMRQTGH